MKLVSVALCVLYSDTEPQFSLTIIFLERKGAQLYALKQNGVQTTNTVTLNLLSTINGKINFSLKVTLSKLLGF